MTLLRVEEEEGEEEGEEEEKKNLQILFSRKGIWMRPPSSPNLWSGRGYHSSF